MRRHSSRHSLHVLSELNITPLLDLAFVLLIIFMITTPLMENTTDLVLPSGKSDMPLNTEAVLRVSVSKTSEIQLNGESTSLEALTAELTSRHQANPDIAVVIRSHKELSVQELIRVIDGVKAAGIKRIGLATTEGEG
jgi:biopolymer transport protein ExbD